MVIYICEEGGMKWGGVIYRQNNGSLGVSPCPIKLLGQQPPPSV